MEVAIILWFDKFFFLDFEEYVSNSCEIQEIPQRTVSNIFT